MACLEKISLICRLSIYPIGCYGRKILFFYLCQFGLESSIFYDIIGKEQKVARVPFSAEARRNIYEVYRKS